MIEQQTEKLLKENARLQEENECFEAMKEGVVIRIANLEDENLRLRDLVRDAYVEGRLALGAAENWASSKSKSKLEVSNE